MKKVISILISVVMIFGAFAVTASAEAEVIPAGFYNIGANANMTFEGLSSDAGVEVTEMSVDVNLDGKNETLYANADGLAVTYANAVAGAYYGVLLVEGTGLPTVDSTIHYIDQVTAEGDSTYFEVFPILPAAKTDLTLYVSCSDASKDLDSVALSYRIAAPAEKEAGSVVLGDVNGDGSWNANDALTTLQIGAGLYPEATAEEKEAADVNADGAWGATDALMILQYGAGIIDSWN